MKREDLPPTKLVNTYEGCSALLETLQNHTEIGFDTESSGPLLVRPRKKKRMVNPYRSSLTGFSLALPTPGGGYDSFYVPFAHHTGNAPVASARDILRATVARERVWEHNTKHERILRVQQGLEADPAGIADSMLACWLGGLPASTGKYNAKDLATTHLGWEMASFEETLALYGQAQWAGVSPEEGARYAGDDALVAILLGRKGMERIREWDLEETFWDVEMPFARVLGDMEAEGLYVDGDALRALSARLDPKMEALKAEWEYLFEDVSISSPVQIREYFYGNGLWSDEGIQTTPGGKPKADREALEVHALRCPSGSPGRRGAEIKLEYQRMATVRSTFTDSLITFAGNYPDGRLHGGFHQPGTRTTRLASSDPNLQNIPIRTDIGQEVKACFRPSPGREYVSADYSQIDLRVLAHFEDDLMADAFRAGEDIHQKTADRFGVPRSPHGKQLNLATVYGAGAWKLSRSCGIPMPRAREMLRLFKEGYPGIDRLKKRIVAAADARGYVKNFLGHRRYIPELQAASKSLRGRGERLAVNTPLQGGAACIVKIAMVLWHQKGFNTQAPLVAQVHDELLLEAPIDIAEDVAKSLQETMEGAYELRVPLVAKPSIGKNWSETK